MRARTWKALGLVLALLVLAGLVIFVQRVPILTWMGGLLVAEDELMKADAIVLLAGGAWDREIEAAELFTAGYAPRVVMTVEPELPTVKYLADRGVTLSTSEERRLQVFAALGVPRERVTVLRKPVTSTFDEARFVGEWAAGANARTLIIVSTPYHTARAKFVFQRQVPPAIRLIMRPTRLSGFKPDTWWTERTMLRDGFFELEKLLVYRLWY